MGTSSNLHKPIYIDRLANMLKTSSILTFFLFTFLFFACLSAIYSQERQLSFDNQDMNFKGCVIVNKKIICYGNYGSIFTSEDNGTTWKKQQVADLRDEIIKLYYNVSKLIGITKNGKSLESDDNGLTWKVEKIATINDIQAIASDSNYIYIREFQSLKVFDYQFNQIATISDTLINVSTKEFPYYLISFREHLLFNSFIGKDIISINKSDLLKGKDSLIERFINDSVSYVSQIQSKKDELLIVYGSNKYKIFNEAVIANENLNKKAMLLDFVNLHTLANFENNIFSLTPLSTNSLSDMGAYSGLKLKKLNSESSKFENVGSSLYIASSLYSSFYSEGGTFNDLVRYDDTTLYIVGDYKSILKSTNNGVNWKFISTKSKILTYSLFKGEKEYHFSKTAENFNSYNDGITYVSNKNDSLLRKELSTYNVDKLPKKTSVNIDTNGNLVVLMPSDYECLVMKSWDFGNSKTISINKKLFIDKNRQYSDEAILSKLDTNYFITQAINTGKQIYTNLYTLDTGMNVVSHKVNEGKKVDFINYSSINDLFVIQSYVLKDGKRIVFSTSTDSGNSFDNLLNVKQEYDKIYPYFIDKVKDSLLIVINRRVDSVNIENLVLLYVLSANKLDTLYKEISPTFARYMLNFNSKLFVVGVDFFLESNNRNNLFDWKRENAYNTYWDNITESDKDYYHVYYSSTKYPGGFYKVRLNNLTSINSEINAEKSYLYFEKPYPIPANNSVKTMIYWNSSFNIEEAELGLYDIFGAKIIATNLSIQKINPFNGNLIVDCSNLSSGIYFAKVNLGIESISIPIVISR